MAGLALQFIFSNMEFTANVVKQNRHTGYIVALVGLGLFLSSIVFFALKLSQTVGLLLALGGIVLVAVGAIVGKGQGLIEVGEELIRFDDTGIHLSGELYPYKDMRNLYFFYSAFYSQSPWGYFYENAGAIRMGMGNLVSFKANGEDIQAYFFIANILHAEMFFSYLQNLTANNISYRMGMERNR